MTAERIKVARVAEMTGLSSRCIQKMATKIPSAARLGKVWTFREEAVRQWLRGKEDETWRATSIAEAKRGGAAFRSTTKTYAKAYEHHLRLKRPRGSTTGSAS